MTGPATRLSGGPATRGDWATLLRLLRVHSEKEDIEASNSVTNRVEQRWDERAKYKYRYVSSQGLPTAQEDFDARRAANLPAYLWKWEHHRPKLMERQEPR